MKAIVRYIRENNCDIVFLQEIWVQSDFETIRNETRDIYKFAHLYKSGSVLGSSGIVLLTKKSPKVIHFEQYSLNGSPFYFWHGDWFAGKGIAYSRIDLDGLSLHLFSTHTHAYYNENETIYDQYSVHRVCQSYQLARFINFICDTACNRRGNSKDLLIVAGDMNSTSSELPYKMLTTMAGLADCFKLSRFYNSNSNIIHWNKLMALKQKLFNIAPSISDSQGNDPDNVATTSKVKRAESFILDTIEEYRLRIAQALHLDSDTEDEDTTYCHPKNSFTGKIKNYKIKSENVKKESLKFAANNEKLTDDNRSDADSTSKGEMSTSNSSQSIISKSTARHKRNPTKRIDFILCRLLNDGCCVVDRVKTDSKDLSSKCSLSDHEPVMVCLKIYNTSSLSESKQEQQVAEPAVTCLHRRHSNEANGHLSGDVIQVGAEGGDNQVIVDRDQTDSTITDTSYAKNVLVETQDILLRYYQSNRRFKTKMFYLVLLTYFMTMPIVTYYALTNELVPVSTIIFMWISISLPVVMGILMVYLYHRSEQAALEAILSDISCRISVAKDHETQLSLVPDGSSN